jgi:hypothetical protein
LRDRAGGGRDRFLAPGLEMSSKAESISLLGAVLLLGFASVWELQKKIDVQLAAVDIEQDDVLLRSPRLMKDLSMEFAPLMADVYWTRAVQYYGNKHVSGDTGLSLLWPLLDIASTLDPGLLPVYHFGSIFLSQKPPGGAGEPEHAAELIQRGIAANPNQWRLYQDLGNIYYFDMQDYGKASQAFLEGSKNPSAAIWMKVMAAKIAGEGHSLETSKFLWAELYRNSKDENIRKNADIHLKLIRSQEDCEAIDKLSAEFEKRNGRRPGTIHELVRAGLLQGMPIDPEKYPYVFGDDGSAQLNPESPLFEKQALFEHFDKVNHGRY